MIRLLAICLFAGILGGCGGTQPTNMIEDADQAAMSEYDRAIADEAAAASQAAASNSSQ